MVMANRADQALQILVDQTIRTDQFLNFVNTAPIGDEFRGGRHIDAVNIWIPYRRRCRRKVHFLCARFARQFDDLLRRCATHYRIVYKQYVFAAKLQIDCI